jgi:prepilin-type N-terminal cleavage/methylation domain-containing protein
MGSHPAAGLRSGGGPPAPGSKARARGYTLVELLVVVAVLGLVLVLGLPPLLDTTARVRVDLGAAEVVGALRGARSWAIRRNQQVAVKFSTGADGRVAFTLYRDGDGDGVLNRDIDSGVDPQVAPAQTLAHLGRRVRFGFPPGKPPRDPGDPRRRLDRLEDPIRFNRSDLASFGSLGGSTPGSLYLTDGRRQLVVVRVLGRTAKVRVLRYDRESESWR